MFRSVVVCVRGVRDFPKITAMHKPRRFVEKLGLLFWLAAFHICEGEQQGVLMGLLLVASMDGEFWARLF